MPSSDMRPPTTPRVAWLATLAPDQLPEQVAAEIGPIAERIGFVPNIARLLAVTPRHFVGLWRYFDELMRGPSAGSTRCQMVLQRHRRGELG